MFLRNKSWFNQVKYRGLNVGSDVVRDLSWADNSGVVISVIPESVVAGRPQRLRYLTMAGDRCPKDTPTSSPIRNAYPVGVIEATSLHQEEANNDIFREIDDYSSSHTAPITTAGDNQTLPASSSTLAAVSSSTTEGGASQPAGEQGEDSRSLLDFIEHSLTVSFTGT
ncbi:hypothetical protein LIER_22318 [Lithospermum erythrorhizon]|uniref:Uncharacterized protein n=1 Tax=Lithospermum erythrorhizon TaxID=34254 RepID=A0AAV3QXN6_LITER